jgi:hypothetical protein
VKTYSIIKDRERCKDHPRHKLTIIERGPMKDGIQQENSECKFCGARFTAMVDHGLLADIFSVPPRR